MKVKSLINIVLFVLLIFCFNSKQAMGMTAEEILKKVADKYTSIKTYRDKGTVKADLGTVKADLRTVEFETYFSKPGSFLFKWTNNDWLYLPKKNKKQFFSESSALKSYKDETYVNYYYKGDLKNRVKKYSDVIVAIASITGISLTSAFYIPSYFFPELNKYKITDLTSPKIIGTQNIGNKECYQITGKWVNRDTEYKLWIEKDTFIIKKFIRDKTIIYSFNKVIIDENIPSHIFDFKPE